MLKVESVEQSYATEMMQIILYDSGTRKKGSTLTLYSNSNAV
jgi:hypothetical protein